MIPEERVFVGSRFRRFLINEWIAICGKTATDNDYLSLHLSEPQDTWMHVDGCPGTHLILLHRENEEPDASVLQKAASITAYHSKARGAPLAKVGISKAGYVSKIKGSPAGQVMVRHMKTLKVKPELPL